MLESPHNEAATTSTLTYLTLQWTNVADALLMHLVLRLPRSGTGEPGNEATTDVTPEIPSSVTPSTCCFLGNVGKKIVLGCVVGSVVFE